MCEVCLADRRAQHVTMRDNPDPDGFNNVAQQARERAGAVLQCVNVLCPGADLRTKKKLAKQILSLANAIDRAMPRKKITPHAVYEMVARNSQCVYDRAGKCPLLVFSEQLAEEINLFVEEGL